MSRTGMPAGGEVTCDVSACGECRPFEVFGLPFPPGGVGGRGDDVFVADVDVNVDLHR
ncbi:MAG: hypothetical protein QM662_04895 [Gordonia sp. (in: high G+C Gram-positive bacteria)]